MKKNNKKIIYLILGILLCILSLSDLINHPFNLLFAIPSGYLLGYSFAKLNTNNCGK